MDRGADERDFTREEAVTFASLFHERKERKQSYHYGIYRTCSRTRIFDRIFVLVAHARPVADPRFRTAMCFSQTTDVNILRPSAETVNDVVGARRCLVTL